MDLGAKAKHSESNGWDDAEAVSGLVEKLIKIALADPWLRECGARALGVR